MEGWKVGAIAGELGVHHSTVTRALRASGDLPAESAAAPAEAPPRRSIVDPWRGFMEATLEATPGIPASRLYQMVVERGYGGGPDHFRRIVADMRPKRQTKAWMRMQVLPGEQAQVDWADFGKVRFGRSERRLYGFVMTLGYSRRHFVRFYYGSSMSHFLHGHVEAFQFYGGVPRKILYDNLKSVVLDRSGTDIRFNATHLALIRHYCFESRPTWPYSPQQKGRVERGIRYVRTGFMAGRDVQTPIGELNRAALEWCGGPVLDRPWPDDPTFTVREMWERERGLLLPLPPAPFPTDDARPARVGKTAYARFETNDYSVPPDHAGGAVTIVAGQTEVRVLDGGVEIARHARSYHKHRTISDPAHVRALLAGKRQARHEFGARGELAAAAPHLVDRLLAAAVERRDPVHIVAGQLLRLLEGYGAPEFERAVEAAERRGSLHPNTVRAALERSRAERGLPPLLPPDRDADPRRSGRSPRANRPSDYDRHVKGDTT